MSDNPTTERELADALLDVMVADAEEGGQFDFAEAINFSDAGLMTTNDGIVVRFPNGAEFQLTIVQSKAADSETDEETDDDDPCPCGVSHTRAEHGYNPDRA